MTTPFLPTHDVPPILSNQTADAAYRDAAGALRQIIADPLVGPTQRAAAAREFERLNTEFIDWATDNAAKRTAAFREFIGAISAVIAAFGQTPDADGVRRLQRIVTDAERVIRAATTPAPLA